MPETALLARTFRHHHCVSDLPTAQRREDTQQNEATKQNADRDARSAFLFRVRQSELVLLDRFQHFECGLVRADKEALEIFAQATTL
jgi:hypothetical protein